MANEERCAKCGDPKRHNVHSEWAMEGGAGHSYTPAPDAVTTTTSPEGSTDDCGCPRDALHTCGVALSGLGGGDIDSYARLAELVPKPCAADGCGQTPLHWIHRSRSRGHAYAPAPSPAREETFYAESVFRETGVGVDVIGAITRAIRAAGEGK
jgi:hypothetical protein